MGGKAPSPSRPSAAETENTREQTELLRAQRDILERTARQQDLLAPFLFEEFGLIPEFGDIDGQREVIGFTQDPQFEAQRQEQRDQLSEQLGINRTQLEIAAEQLRIQQENLPTQEALQAAQLELSNLGIQMNIEQLERIRQDEAQFGGIRREVEQLQLERSKAALKGELPVASGLVAEFNKAEEQLKENLLRQLGPGFETSSAGIEALAEFEQRKQQTFDAARRGDISQIESLSISRQAANRQTFGDTFPGIGTNFTGLNTAQIPNITGAAGVASQGFATAQAFGGGAQGFGNLVAGQRQDRQFRDQFNLNAFQTQQQTFGSIFQGIGSVVGIAAGAGLAFCWIAAELYGYGSEDFWMARHWIFKGWKGRLADICRKLYLRYGHGAGLFMRHRPWLKRLVRPLFDLAVSKGRTDYYGSR